MLPWPTDDEEDFHLFVLTVYRELPTRIEIGCVQLALKATLAQSPIGASQNWPLLSRCQGLAPSLPNRRLHWECGWKRGIDLSLIGRVSELARLLVCLE